MSFDIVFNYILRRSGIGCGAGPDGFRELLERLGNPQNQYKIIHVAGTNGKGSVCTLTARILTCAGYKTGLFVSPHLVSPTERIQIDGEAISKKQFSQAVLEVFQEEEEELNFFEILTAAALVYFARQKVQYAVLETGLGGRKDPTNSCVPVLSLITSIGLDHMQYLGSSLTQIAREKAGIIKPGVPVISGTVNPAARDVIRQTAKKQKAPLRFVGEGEPFFEYAYDFVNNQTVLHTRDGEEWLLQLIAYLEENDRAFHAFCAERLPQFPLTRLEGTYLEWMDCTALHLSSEKLEHVLLEKAQLWLNAGTMYGSEGEGYMRWNIACPRSRMLEGLERFAEFLQK